MNKKQEAALTALKLTDDVPDSEPEMRDDGTAVFDWDDDCQLAINTSGNVSITPRGMNV